MMTRTGILVIGHQACEIGVSGMLPGSDGGAAQQQLFLFL